MRPLIVIEHVSQDGVIQGPGSLYEDTSHHFQKGGWIIPYSDESVGEFIKNIMRSSFDLLLGRKTYDLWAAYWPFHDGWKEANQAIKYVVSHQSYPSLWEPTIFINSDVVEKILKLKQGDGKPIHVWGSSELVETLIKHDLVDNLWLMVYPIHLGEGKKLFQFESLENYFHEVGHHVSPQGVQMIKYDKRIVSLDDLSS
ncbi:MAG TPA: dihydrofolate reductase family protein [Acholeplasmataceae bacterium]|nr:dihydrofolate reductase family protein [Acholeplasmataceae bacterium]HRX45615.1 dihydrofolate reductase family protein [Acholeplasmataceae bacterium]